MDINGDLRIASLSSDPIYKAIINSGNNKVVIGTGPGQLKPDEKKGKNEYPQFGAGYIGFNTSFNYDHWDLSGSGTSESDAGSIIYSSLDGGLFFCTIPTSGIGGQPRSLTQTDIWGQTKMVITPEGNVRIGEKDGPYLSSLEIRKSSGAKILCNSLTTESSSIWTQNTVHGYGFIVDQSGVGHISENFQQPNSIISFQSGKVGIGDINFNMCGGNSKLFVEGGITTEEVIVKVKSDWSDFVFNKDYKLKPLTEVSKFISENNHLPDIPSSKDVAKDGIELGAMNALLLRKIEELTLYVIEQQKQIETLKQSIKK